MTIHWMKFLAKLDEKIRLKVEKVIEAILKNDFENIEIKPLSGKKGYFKIRIGKIRIIFIKSNDGEENIIEKIDFRGDVYKGI